MGNREVGRQRVCVWFVKAFGCRWEMMMLRMVTMDFPLSSECVMCHGRGFALAKVYLGS